MLLYLSLYMRMSLLWGLFIRVTFWDNNVQYMEFIISGGRFQWLRLKSPKRVLHIVSAMDRGGA